MALSTPRAMASLFLSAMALVALVSGQSVQPSNATLPSSESIFTQLNIPGGTTTTTTQTVFNIAPLTQNVGMGESANTVAAVTFGGDLQLIDSTNYNTASKNDISYISCDNDVNSMITQSTVVSNVGEIRPQGIILFSTTSKECNLTGNFPSTTIYTMTSAEDSSTLLRVIQSGMVQATVASNSTTGNGANGASTNNSGGPAPTTAVAMSILYSITGIITLLFLIIIATGAIRAHRHPERYGPRTGVTGRPRQSRAKGLARAMLETLPIVKFGDPEPVKPGSGDVELENGTSSVHGSIEHTVPVTTQNGDSKAIASTQVEQSGVVPATAESIKSGQEVIKKEEDLGCSICTEDFTTGEDVRVLPCQHKYHPACIDPWLLNVSGTCPLCRHDLRPKTSPTDPASPTTGEESELPPPLAINEDGEHGAENATESDNASASHQRNRVARFLDLNRLRHAPADERIAALRQLREQSQREGAAAEDVEEPSRRARLTGRLRDTFRIRTRTAAQE